MGQWRRDTLDVLADPLFWHIVDAMSASHAAPTHVQTFMQKAGCSSNQGSDDGGQLAQLVESRSREFEMQFSDAFSNFDWSGVHAKLAAADD
eukprot:3200815-Pyramimonas_sp.AAC.1